MDIKERRVHELKREVDRLAVELNRYKRVVHNMRREEVTMRNLIKTIHFKNSLSQDTLNKRRSKRQMVSLITRFASNNSSYTALIENISEEGIFMRVSPSSNGLTLTPGSKLKLLIKLPSGEFLSSQCNVIWSYKTPPHGLINSAGMEIMNPSPQYADFLRIL